MSKILDDVMAKMFNSMQKAWLRKSGASLQNATVPVVQETDGNQLFTPSSISSADLSKLSGASALSGTIADAISGIRCRYFTSITCKDDASVGGDGYMNVLYPAQLGMNNFENCFIIVRCDGWLLRPVVVATTSTQCNIRTWCMRAIAPDGSDIYLLKDSPITVDVLVIHL